MEQLLNESEMLKNRELLSQGMENKKLYPWFTVAAGFLILAVVVHFLR